MTPNHIRILGSIVLFGFLLLFFVPIVYDATMFRCTDPRALCLVNTAGLKSIGYALFHWGSAYSLAYPPLAGYDFSPSGYFAYPDGSRLTTEAILFFLAFPIAIAGAALIEPESIAKNKFMRIFYAALGILTLTVAAGYLSLFASQGLNPVLGFVSAVLLLTGQIVTLYAVRPRTFS